MINSRKLNIFEKLVLLLYELNKKMENDSYITYAIAAQISFPIGVAAYAMFIFLVYDILHIFDINYNNDKVFTGLDVAAILFALCFIYMFEKKVNKTINFAYEEGYFNERIENLYDKSIVNYYTKCNRLEGKYKNGVCSKCESKLTKIE